MEPAGSIRTRAGLSLADAARAARISPGYLRRIERQGGAAWGLALRLARVYGCRPEHFLWPQVGGGTPSAARRESDPPRRKPRNPGGHV